MKKKFLFALAAIMTMAFSSVVFTSCGDDSNDPVVSGPTCKKVEFEIVAEPTADMLKYADIAVEVTDENGAVQTYKVDSEKYTKVVAYSKFPVTGTVKYTSKVKAGVSPADDDLVRWSKIINVYTRRTMSDGTIEKGLLATKGGGLSLKGKDLADYVSKDNVATMMNEPFTIDKNGLVSNK